METLEQQQHVEKKARTPNRTAIIVTAVVVALALLTAAVVFANGSDGTADEQPIVRIFDSAGNPTAGDEVLGESKLVRRDDGLKATAQVSGLTPDGVYTFWWVAIPEGGSFPDNAFVASGGGDVVGDSGKASAEMTAELGQSSIEGFLIPFQPLDFDLATAEVHVEIAYHGQATAIDDLDEALGNFWSGPACPDNGLNPGGDPTGDPGGAGPGVSNPGQPHCPVSIVAIHTP